MKTIRYRSGMPYLLCGLIVLLYAFVFGLGSMLGYVGALLLAYLAYAPIARLFPDRYVVVEEFPIAKDARANALIQECAPHMRSIRAAGDIIYDPWLLEKVDIITIGYRGLLKALSEDPALLEPLSAYLRYLLPNTVMLLNVRVKLQDRHLDADKVNTRRRIDEALIAVEQSLDKQLGLLAEQQPLRVEEDIQHLKHMLGQSGILQPGAEAAMPEEQPEALIAEQLDARRHDLLRVLQDRLAVLQPEIAAAGTEAEEPSVYAASTATAAPALVVPAISEAPEAPPPLSAPEIPSRVEAKEDYQEARKRLISILEESVQRLEAKEAEEAEPAQETAETPAPTASDTETLDRLIADAQTALFTGETQPEETADVESGEHILEDSPPKVEIEDKTQAEFGSVVDDAKDFVESAPPITEVFRLQEKPEAASEASPADALPQAGDWFSMEGFEDEDDVPVYQQATPTPWIAPAVPSETPPPDALDAVETIPADAESFVSAPEGTDVPSVMDVSEETKLLAWMDTPAMQEEKPVGILQQALQQAMVTVRNTRSTGQTDPLSGRDYLTEIGKQFAVALQQPALPALYGESQDMPTFQAPRVQRGRMTSRQIEEMVLGDILSSQGLQDFGRLGTNSEETARKRKPRMEIDKSVLMALLGHDGNESAYLQ